MRDNRVSACAVVALAILLSGMAWPAPAASGQGEPLQLVSTTYYIVQGDSGLVAGDEKANEFTFLEILSYKLPYDVDRVYANVPSDARNVTTWVASHGLINSTNGREDSGPMAGRLYVDVPSWFERSAVVTNATNGTQSILAAGSVLTNLSYDSGHLHLLPGNTSGAYTSAQIPVPECITVLSANLTLFGTDLQDVSAELSNDGGSTWVGAVPGLETPMSSAGTSFLVRLVFQGNESAPLVTGFRATIRYLLPSTTFTIHVTYLWPAELVDGRLSLDLTEPVPYAPSGSSFVFLYVLKGYAPEGTGITLNHDEDGDPSQPDKDVYVNMTLSLSGTPTRTIQVTEPEQSWAWLWALAILGAAVLGVAYVMWRRRPAPPGHIGESAAEDTGSQATTELSLSERKSMLAAKKAELSARIEEVSKAKASGTVAVEEAEKELVSLKSEFRKVRNELNRVRKKKGAPGERAGESVPDSTYESILASIARLDEDHEKGRLPEKTYQSLRKDYKARAAEALASRAYAEAAENLLEREKNKLLEAIAALDEERDRGEVDADVHAELRASYRKELADILRQIEESKEQ